MSEIARLYGVSISAKAAWLAASCANVSPRAGVPASVSAMAPIVAICARMSDAPEVRSASTSAALSLRSIACGTTPKPANVAMSDTAAPVTTIVPPVVSARTDPAPSSTPAASICATVREIVPESLTVMPVTEPILPTRTEEPEPRSA